VRRRAIAEAASGFIYAVSLTGVTGAPLDVNSPSLRAQLEDLRAETSLPIAVGFGVRNARQVSALAATADGVVVGSALVRAAHDGGAERLAALVAELRSATKR
jgi:tryptophan synthase alpha chain